MDHNRSIFKIFEDDGDNLGREGSNLVRANAGRFFTGDAKGVRAFDKHGSAFKARAAFNPAFAGFLHEFMDATVFAVSYIEGQPGYTAQVYRDGVLESERIATEGDACSFARRMDGRSCAKIANMFQKVN